MYDTICPRFGEHFIIRSVTVVKVISEKSL